MFASAGIEANSKEEFYHALATQASHLIDGETNEWANLSNVSALLNMHLQDINWVGFYLWYEQEQTLILGPFQGKPACIRIAPGKGVCGTAVATRTAQVVPDVFAFPGHIACDPASRSEVVLPILDGERMIGVLDIDSPTPNRFDSDDAIGLQKVVDVLVKGTQFSKR